MPQITAVLNPISQKRVTATVPAGKPLREIMDLPDGLLIERNGEPYANEPLQDDDLINIVMVPQGNSNVGDKDGLRYSAAAVLMVASVYFSSGATLFGSKFLAGAVSVASAIGANPLILTEGEE